MLSFSTIPHLGISSAKVQLFHNKLSNLLKNLRKDWKTKIKTNHFYRRLRFRLMLSWKVIKQKREALNK